MSFFVRNSSLSSTHCSSKDPKSLPSCSLQPSLDAAANIAPGLIEIVNREYVPMAPPSKKRRIEVQSPQALADPGKENIETVSQKEPDNQSSFGQNDLLEKSTDPIISIWAPNGNLTEKLVRFASGNVYDGSWLDGKPHGPGLMRTRNGHRFRGNFVEGKLLNGTVFYPSGDMRSFYKGPLSKYLPQGHGEISYTNRDYYKGEFKEGLRHGNGKLFSEIGKLLYQGQWENDLPHGEGKGMSGSAIYQGQWLNGAPDGNGVMGLSGGIRIEGQFTNGEPTLGKIFYRTGETYEGPIKNQAPHGAGIATLIGNEGSYMGEFLDGKRQGKGKWLSSTNELIYDGEWQNNLPNGSGVMQLSNGKRFEGQVINGEPTLGKIFFPTGAIYEGTVKKRRPHGFGKLGYQEGDFCEGEFVNGIANGEGKVVRANGTVSYKGTLKDGLPDGEGMGFVESGELCIGNWESGLWAPKKKS